MPFILKIDQKPYIFPRLFKPITEVGFSRKYKVFIVKSVFIVKQWFQYV